MNQTYLFIMLIAFLMFIIDESEEENDESNG